MQDILWNPQVCVLCDFPIGSSNSGVQYRQCKHQRNWGTWTINHFLKSVLIFLLWIPPNSDLTYERKCVEICFSVVCVDPQQPWIEYSWAPSFFLDAFLFSLFLRDMKGKKRTDLCLQVLQTASRIFLFTNCSVSQITFFFFFFHEKCWKFISCDMVTRCILILLVHCVNCSLLLISLQLVCF